MLMASIMRTCKHEDLFEFSKHVKWQKKENYKPKDYKDRALLEIDIGEGTKEEDEEEEDVAETDEKTKEEGKEPETIDDRVFVCLGKSTDGLDKIQIWVMTVNKTFDTITFWDAKE